jgi:hypothetical protein
VNPIELVNSERHATLKRAARLLDDLTLCIVNIFESECLLISNSFDDFIL